MSDAFFYCRWCGAAWNTNDPEGFQRHEGHCAYSVSCPRCGAAPTANCYTVGGNTAYSTHSVRERRARVLSLESPEAGDRT